LTLPTTALSHNRCRQLYAKYLAAAPHNCAAWGRFAGLERAVGEDDRARAVYELAVGQPVLDMPETLWKAYIDFEIAEGDSTRARALYERLLQRTQHVKVWTSFGAFEAKEGEGIASARAVYERAYSALKAAGLNEVRACCITLLLFTWCESCSNS
jgi:crooked neck